MKKKDIWIIVILLTAAVLGMAAVRLFTPEANSDYAYIYVGKESEPYKKVSLSQDQVIEIDQGNGVVNHVEVKNGAIFMADSSCPDKQCVYQGEITPENCDTRILRNWIICLPNEVTVELVLGED